MSNFKDIFELGRLGKIFGMNFPGHFSRYQALHLIIQYYLGEVHTDVSLKQELRIVDKILENFEFDEYKVFEELTRLLAWIKDKEFRDEERSGSEEFKVHLEVVDRIKKNLEGRDIQSVALIFDLMKR